MIGLCRQSRALRTLGLRARTGLNSGLRHAGYVRAAQAMETTCFSFGFRSYFGFDRQARLCPNGSQETDDSICGRVHTHRLDLRLRDAANPVRINESSKSCQPKPAFDSSWDIYIKYWRHGPGFVRKVVGIKVVRASNPR